MILSDRHSPNCFVLEIRILAFPGFWNLEFVAFIRVRPCPSVVSLRPFLYFCPHFFALIPRFFGAISVRIPMPAKPHRLSRLSIFRPSGTAPKPLVPVTHLHFFPTLFFGLLPE